MTTTAACFDIDHDLFRLRQEFLDMPGTCLTVPQAMRLLGVSFEAADLALTTLQQEGSLYRTTNGVFRRTYPAQS
jgi:hypothetical protein